MSMVEKVARAMYAEVYDMDPPAQWDGLGLEEERGVDLRALARAALRAMREPSAAMVDSGVAFALNVSLGGDYKWSQYVADKHRAMLAAALAEDPSR